MLKRGAERRKRDFWYLSAARKGEKEILGAKAWRGKAKKRDFRCLSAARKGKKEIFGA